MNKLLSYHQSWLAMTLQRCESRVCAGGASWPGGCDPQHARKRTPFAGGLFQCEQVPHAAPGYCQGGGRPGGGGQGVRESGERARVAGGLLQGDQVPHAVAGDCQGGGRPGGGGRLTCSIHSVLSTGIGRRKQMSFTVPRTSPSSSLQAQFTTGYSITSTVTTVRIPSMVSGVSKHRLRTVCPHAYSEPNICAIP